MHRTPGQSSAANDQAWSEKGAWHGLHAQCGHFGRPGLDPYYGSAGLPGAGHAARGMHLGEDVYDSTLARAVTKLANRIVQDVCPPGIEWAHFTGTLTRQGESENTARLQTLQRRAFKAFHTSNGDQALHEMILDCVVYGTGVVRVGTGSEPEVPLVLDSSSQVEVALERGPRGAIWGYHRKFLMPREHIMALWPNAEVPDDEPMSGDHGPLMPPRYDVQESTYYDGDAGHWWYDVLTRGLWRGGRSDDPSIQRIFEERTPISRWIGWRWARMPGEVYGRSPTMDALPDAMTASELVRILLETGSMRVGGMFTVRNDSNVNVDTIRMESGTFIPVESNQRDNPSISALEVGGDANMGQLLLEELRMSIMKAMLAQELPPEGAGIRSATEWVARQKELNSAIGAAFSRLVEELLRPLMQAVVYVLSEQQLLADVGIPAGQLMRLDGTDMGLQFTSPLVRSQKMQDVAAIVEGSQMAQAAAGPVAFQAAANAPRIAAKILKLQELDKELYREEDEAEEMYQAQMQAQAAAAQPPSVGDQPGGMEAAA